MAEVTLVMLTMLHDDFKTLYRSADEVGNEDVAPLIDECTVFHDESFPNVLHILWDFWEDDGKGEQFVEGFIRERSHHIAYVMGDRSVIEREEKIVEDDVDLGSYVMNTRILRSVIPLVTPANYAEDTYGGVDWNNPVSAADAYDEPVYYYMVDDLNRG